jgi:hypothetical protein
MSDKMMPSEDKSPDETLPPLGEKAGWNYPKPEHLPEPTYWPLVVAFGVVLALFGIVHTIAVTYVISGVGLVIMGIGISGWIGELRRGE